MPPQLKQLSPWQKARPARGLAYVAILLEEAHVDPNKIPKGQVVFAMVSPYEERGVTTRDIERWVKECDPPERTTPPALDPVACFRAKARAAMRPRPGLGTKVAIIAGASFLGSFLLARARK